MIYSRGPAAGCLPAGASDLQLSTGDIVIDQKPARAAGTTPRAVMLQALEVIE